MNKLSKILYWKKAGIIACLFSFYSIDAFSQDWIFEPSVQAEYDKVLNLEIPQIKEPKTIEEFYIISLHEALELLITEDAEKFSAYEQHHLELQGKKIKGSDAQYQFYQAELRLQWAFVYLKFGHEFDAALNLRQAYNIAEECKRKNPKFIPIRKTTGLLEIIIGSVPEKYNWVLGLLGMEGAIGEGLADLEMVRNSSSSVAFEADVLYALIQGFIFQNTDAGVKEIQNLLTSKTDNRLLTFLGGALSIKNSQSEQALSMLDSLKHPSHAIHLHYADYLRGEVYLHKADYLDAISSYRWFINHHRGQNYIKDAHYKIALCYWLNGNVNDAAIAFRDAKSKGKETAEADKYAARSLAEKDLPNVKLSKVRYFTDGGFYVDAEKQLDNITPNDIPTKRDQVEFHYRKARLAHKLNKLSEAKKSYAETITLAGDENWYFAPNACLQLGYIAIVEKQNSEAKSYFTRALSYNKHEYKNSIDSKAKTALAQLNKK